MDFDNKFLDSSSQFSGELYQQTIHGVNGNVVFSPMSILTALSFLMFGASGRTFTQMKSSLKFDGIPIEDLEKNFQKLTNKFGSGGLSVANKIYLMKDFSIKPSFKDIAIKNFHSEIESINFAKNKEASANINKWVESKTNNKIKDLIKPDFLSTDTRLVLVNAIHFKAEWVHPFTIDENFKDQFYLNEQDTVEVEYMSQRRRHFYGTFDELDATAVQLAYKDSNVKMLFVLPNSKTGLSALESKLNKINLNDLTKKMVSRDVRLALPKFKVEFDINLEEPLTKMGMDLMFSDAAELYNLLDSKVALKVSKVVHKAFIEVNEKGTEAGGATGLGIEVMSVPKYVRLDRPFLFALIEDSNVLFMGRKVK